jgi:hypothetical protein
MGPSRKCSTRWRAAASPEAMGGVWLVRPQVARVGRGILERFSEGEKRVEVGVGGVLSSLSQALE